MTYVRDDLRPLQRRIAWLSLWVFVGFCILSARLWILQVVQGQRWQRLAENNRLRKIPLEAPRGTVRDINGEVLLDNRPAFQLLIFPEEMTSAEETAKFLASIGIAPLPEVQARILRAAKTSHLPSVIADNLTFAQVAAIAAHRAEHKELEVHPTSRRRVPLGPVVAHVVGQLGEVSPEQLAQNPALRPGQLVGRSGIERAYQEVLGGEQGNMVVVVDALGRQVSTLEEEKPVPGKPLSVTLDLRLQQEAAKALGRQVGAVVGLDPRSGEVRILLSQPSFDPDLFAGHLEPQKWRELNSDPLHPLHNRAIQGLYPPGSTIKPLYAAAALAAGLRTKDQKVTCTGGVTYYGHPYRCWLAGGHGPVDLMEALEVSCDTYFYALARDAGIERLAAWARLFGLGSPTGIELLGEASGLVGDDAWSRRVRGHPWLAGETISAGIGQGPILVTPLQLAVAYAALVNGGFLVRPHLVRGQGAAPKPLGLPSDALAQVRAGMERVVSGARGTARRLGLSGILAGKTGTAQVMRKKEGMSWRELPWAQRHHALFVGYAPARDPQLVVAVVVEHGGDGAAVAAPIAGRILAKALGISLEEVPAVMAAEVSLPEAPAGGGG